MHQFLIDFLGMILLGQQKNKKILMLAFSLRLDILFNEQVRGFVLLKNIFLNFGKMKELRWEMKSIILQLINMMMIRQFVCHLLKKHLN
jgi:hypothetical protein